MTDDPKEENRKLHRAVEELTILNDISVAISGIAGAESVTNLIIQKCVRHIGAEQGAIWLIDPENQAAPPKTFLRVMDPKFSGLPFRIGASITGWILRNRNPLVINEIAGDKRFIDLIGEHKEIRGLLAVPLKLKNSITGVICLLNKNGSVGFSPDDVRLLSIVATQSAQAIESARLYEEEQKLRNLEEDLRTARLIQNSLLPKEDPVVEGFDVAGLYTPAQLIGGDYYDFIKIDEEHLGVAIADVSGKGTPAALLMASLQSCLRSQSLLSRTPLETVAILNMTFSKMLISGKFISLLYGVLDTQTRSFRYVNAGHCYPIFVKQGRPQLLENSGIVLGVSPQYAYMESEIIFSQGDSLLLYTDGVTEAMNTVNEQYGEDRLIQLLESARDSRASNLLRRIEDSVKGFQSEVPQSDDITIVSLTSL